MNIIGSGAQWPLHFRRNINSWGMCSDENINFGAILSFDVVCMGSPVIIMLQKM